MLLYESVVVAAFELVAVRRVGIRLGFVISVGLRVVCRKALVAALVSAVVLVGNTVALVAAFIAAVCAFVYVVLRAVVIARIRLRRSSVLVFAVASANQH